MQSNTYCRVPPNLIWFKLLLCMLHICKKKLLYHVLRPKIGQAMNWTKHQSLLDILRACDVTWKPVSMHFKLFPGRRQRCQMLALLFWQETKTINVWIWEIWLRAFESFCTVNKTHYTFIACSKFEKIFPMTTCRFKCKCKERAYSESSQYSLFSTQIVNKKQYKYWHNNNKKS